MLREGPVDLPARFAEIRKTPVEEITLKGAVEAIKSHGQDALRGMAPEVLDNAADVALGWAESIIEDGQDCGDITVDELGALRMYTDAYQGSLFSLVNHHLVYTRHLQPFVPYIWLLLLALKKCPVFSGTTVYRGIRLEGPELEAFLSEYHKNARIQWNRFTSTSAIVSVQQSFLDKRVVQDAKGNPIRLLSGVMFHIHLRPLAGARVVSQYSKFPDEMEVLLPPGFQFEVVDMVSPYPGLHIIQLKETRNKSPIIELSVEVGLCRIPRCNSDVEAEFVAKLHSLKLANENCDDAPQDGSVRGVLSGCWRLTEAALKQLFTSESASVRRSYPVGRGVRDVAVVKADPESSEERGLSFHFKSNPEFPFNELAISQLGLMLFGDAVLHDVLEVWMCGRWHVFLVSETVVGGKTLAEELRWSDKDLPEEERLRLSKALSRRMCRKSFGRSCLMAMLCRLQDQKPDNVLIREDGTLACIDNERAFVVDRCGYWNGKSEVQSALFCVNYMRSSNIHSDLVDIINGWGEDCEFRLVESWLRRLSDLMEDAEGRMSYFKCSHGSAPEKELEPNANVEKRDSTPFGLAPAVVWNLIVGITNIKRYAGNCSYLKLLEILLPQTSHSYGPVLSREESIQKRFGSASEYDGSSQCSKLATSEVMMKVLNERIGPIQGLEWLTSSHETLQSPANLLSFAANIKVGLLATTVGMMNMLNEDSPLLLDEKDWMKRLKQLVNVLHQMGLLGHLLAKVDFSKGAISYKERQTSFLHRMGKFQHSHLVIANAAHLTVELLQRLLLASPDLIFLALIRCTPSCHNLTFPNQGMLKLRQLRIESMSLGAEVDLSAMTSLTKVELIKVSGVRKTVLSPTCEHLDLTDTWTTEMDVIQLGQTIGLKRENVIGVGLDSPVLLEHVRSELLNGNMEPLRKLPTTFEIEAILRSAEANLGTTTAPTLTELSEMLSTTCFHSFYNLNAAWTNKAAFVRAVSHSKYLRLLSLKGSNISKKSFLALTASHLVHLTSLDLSDCPKLELSTMELHLVAKNLERLDLSNTGTTAFDIVEQGYFIRDNKLYLPRLKWLSLSRCQLFRRFHFQRAYEYLILPDMKDVAVTAYVAAIPALVVLLKHKNKRSRLSATEALLALAVDADRKDAIVGAGAIPHLVRNLCHQDNETTRATVETLNILAFNKNVQIAIARARAIPALIKLLENSDTEIRRYASGIFQNLAMIMDDIAHAIPALVNLLYDGDTEIRRNVSMALRNLAMNRNNQTKIASAVSEAIFPLVSLLDYQDIEIRRNMFCILRNLTLSSDHQDAIAKLEGIPVLMKALNDGDTEVQREAAGALRNLSVTPNYQSTIAGAIPALVSLLTDGDTETRRQAAGTLKNLAFTSKYQISIANAGAIPALVSLLRDDNDEARRDAAGTLKNLALTSKYQIVMVKAQAIPALVSLLKDGDTETRREAAGALKNLALIWEYQIIIANAEAIPTLASLLRDSDTETRREAAGALKNLASTSKHQVSIAKTDAIPLLVSLLIDGRTETRREAAGALKNLSVNKDNQIAIAKAEGIPPLASLLKDDDTETKREAAGALKNLALNPGNHAAIANAQAIPALVSLLNDADTEIRREVSGALQNLQ